MCRLFGITQFDYESHRELLASFVQLGEKGKTLAGDPPGHLDGWGIGWFDRGTARIYKSGGSVFDEKRKFFDILERIHRSPIVIAHLRKSAWKQTSVRRHAHPFAYRNTFFAHNGTVRDYKKLLPLIPGQERPRTDALDTEAFFRFIMTRGDPDPARSCLSAARYIGKNNIYTSLTCLLAANNTLYAYRDYRKSPDYYTLYAARMGRSDIVSSEPLTPELRWKMLMNTELRRLK